MRFFGLFILLSGVAPVALGEVNSERLGVDLESGWRLISASGEEEALTELGPVPPSAGRRFALENSFQVPATLAELPVAFLIGTVATFPTVIINGVRVSPPTDGKPQFVEVPDNFPRLYPIPSGVLRPGSNNQVRVEIERSYGGPAGILSGPVRVGPEADLRLLAGRRQTPFLLFEICVVTLIGFGILLVLLLTIRQGGGAAPASFLPLACLVLFAFLSESHLFHALGWKTPWLVRAGWCAFGLIPPTVLWFLGRLIGRLIGWKTRAVFAASALLAVLLLLLPRPEFLAVPFAILSLGSFTGSAFLAHDAVRLRQKEAIPAALGLCLALCFSLLGIAEILGWTDLPIPPLPQKGIFFFQIALLCFYLSLLFALCDGFIRSRQVIEQLARQSIAWRDVERARLARDLHDRLGQSLQSMLLRLRNGDREESERHRLVGDLRDLLDEVREIAGDLHPAALDVLPLASVLESFLEEQRAVLPFTVETRIECRRKFAPEVELHLFCIFREALNNAIRHSAATTVWLDFLERSRRLNLSLTDNGTGCKDRPCSRGLGMRTMEERARMLGGGLVLEHPDTGGLRVLVDIPLPNPQPDRELGSPETYR